jgi:DNA-binding MarR family transcriptional regulator
MLSQKQIILLFLISSEPGIKDIYTLVKIFDKVDFPSNMTENLTELIQKNFVSVSENFENGTAQKYQTTENGKNFLKHNFDSEKIIEYVKTMCDPKLLLEIMQTYIAK